MKNMPFRCTDRIRSKSASVTSSNGLRMFMPALLNRISTGPNAAATSSANFLPAAMSATSTDRCSTRRPKAAISRAVTSAWASSFRWQKAMSAPSRAKASAVARPMPREPPVTSAIFPASCMAHSLSCSAYNIRLIHADETGWGKQPPHRLSRCQRPGVTRSGPSSAESSNKTPRPRHVLNIFIAHYDKIDNKSNNVIVFALVALQTSNYIYIL